MKNNKEIFFVIRFIGFLLIAAGVGVLLFPRVTDLLYRKNVEKQKDAFMQQTTVQEKIEDPKQQMTQAEVSPLEELYRELIRQNRKLFEERQKDLVDPFSYEQQGIDLTQYGLPDSIIGFLTIPKMDIELPILLGANDENMRFGAVHLTQTSYPIGGSSTNCVIAAHRGYSKTAMFRDIERLELGDLVYIQNFRESLTYKVVEIRVVEPTDIDACLIQEGRDLITLVTCHPLGHNYQRYLVFCERVTE